MPEPRGIPSLRAFLDSLQSAQHSEYAARAANRVAHEAAFSEMQAHILELYEQVEAPHSFVDESGGDLRLHPYRAAAVLERVGGGGAERA
jgi:hypothetical protein